MNAGQALQKLTEVLRRKHFALSTEHSYCAWLRRYCHYLKKLPATLPSELKLERFLTALAKQDVSASTQNLAFNAIVFFYQEAMVVELKNVQEVMDKMRFLPPRAKT